MLWAEILAGGVVVLLIMREIKDKKYVSIRGWGWRFYGGDKPPPD
jgi:hypothetical protein